MEIGLKIYKPVKDYNYYSQVAQWCNSNSAHIEDKTTYYEVVANTPAPTPSLQEQLEQKEDAYGMNRWQRELILADNSQASDYNKAKAQELEDLAEQIRQLNAQE